MKIRFSIGLLAFLAGSPYVPLLGARPTAEAQVKVFGNFYPERDDDLAWENDLIGYRAYGPAKVRKGERVYGYDVWLKRGGADPFLPAAYWMDITAGVNYHHDHGRGMDCYAVGPTLGAGTAALLMTDSRGNDSIAFPWAYEKAEILENGPDRFRAMLAYPSGERREISLEAGRHLNRTQVWWPDSLLSRAKAVIVGFPIHEPSHEFHVLEGGSALTYLDPTQGDDNGELYLGIAVPGQALATGEMLGHAAIVAPKPAHGKPFVYYWGAGWNRGDVPSHQAWDQMVGEESNEKGHETAELTSSEIGLGWAATSVNGAIFRHSPLCTSGDTQYAAYYDPDGYVTLARRQLSDTTWTVRRTAYKGNVADGHNVISIGVDGHGYLHCAFDHHGTPLHYACSVAPGSLQLSPLEPMTGTEEQDVTYPEFHRLPGGDLLFAYRSGASGSGDMVLNRYDVKTGRWHRVHSKLLDGEGQRNAYWQMTSDSAGCLHLSWVWRETWMVETNHDLCYARSCDGGLTWQRSDGTDYALPITASTAEVAWAVPQGSELINQTSMAADGAGHPYIATYWRDADSDVPQYRLVWHDGQKWRMEQVSQRTAPFSLSGGGTKMIPISRPLIVSDGTKAFYVYRDAQEGSRLSALFTPRIGKAPWQHFYLTSSSVDAYEPIYDEALWNDSHHLHLMVQQVHQGDGEHLSSDTIPTPVSVIELTLPQ